MKNLVIITVAIMAMLLVENCFGQIFVKTGFNSEGLGQKVIESRLGVPRVELGYIILEKNLEGDYIEKGIRYEYARWDIYISSETAGITALGSELHYQDGFTGVDIKIKMGTMYDFSKINPYLYYKGTTNFFLICTEAEFMYASRSNNYTTVGMGLKTPEIVYKNTSLTIKSLYKMYSKYYKDQQRLDWMEYVSTDISIDWDKKIFLSTGVNLYYHTDLDFQELENKVGMEASLKYIF